RPRHGAALNQRGNALIALGRHAEAIGTYDALLALDPHHAEAHNNRSIALGGLGRWAEALQSCEAALALRPAYADAHCNRGNALFALNRFDDAAASFSAALAAEPRRTDALNSLGLSLFTLRRHAEALEKFDAVLAIDARHADALNNRGVVLAKLRRHGEALASYDAALAVAPGRADIDVNRGTALVELGRADEAVAAFDRVLAADPRNVTALINRGNALIKDKRFGDALGSYDHALAIDPAHAAALTDRGVALAELERFEEALAAHEAALRTDPHIVAAHVNRGNAMLKLARMEEALAGYTEALALEPDNAEANFNGSLVRLCLGDFAGGWPQYEYRWKKKDFMSSVPDYPRPLWRGDADLNGKTIFLLAEQGLGDSLQFVRYVPLVAERGAKVVLGVQKPLRVLATSVPGVSLVRTDGEPLPDFDTYCPLLSLPLAFGTELATIPANIPYLRPHAERLAQWRPRLPDNGRLRIGICWAGSNQHLNDRNRSMPLDRFAALLSVPNLGFVCIQKEVSAADAALLEHHGVLQLGREFGDFADTAAVVAMLDLLISVDTSVAHLAGAMGKAVALLVPFSPDFRWLMHRTDSPWYPTMRLFRQTALGDWSEPLAKLRAELEDVARRPGRAG